MKLIFIKEVDCKISIEYKICSNYGSFTHTEWVIIHKAKSLAVNLNDVIPFQWNL